MLVRPLADGEDFSAAMNTLRKISLFSRASETELTALAQHALIKTVRRTARLIQAGDVSDKLYIILRGHFVVQAGEKTIAEIGPGEPVGELGFFADRKRTADVLATRDGEVMELSREAYDAVVAAYPGLARQIMAVMAERLAEKAPKSPALLPRPGKTIALVPAGNGTLPAEFLDKLKNAILNLTGKADVGLKIVERSHCPKTAMADERRLSKWLAGQEAGSQQVVLVGDNGADTLWNRTITSNADTLYLACEKASARNGPVAVSALERRIATDALAPRIHLVIWRDRNDRAIRNTSNWLQGRKSHLHHHLALNNEADFARLARFMKGRALGIVMCGGGAFGTAHLGAIKALQEAGIPIDMYGGTSVGAAMAAALATGMTPDEVLDLCEEIFVRSKAMSRISFPLHSVLDHKGFDAQIKKHYNDHLVENLPVNFFAVATSLTRNDIHIIRDGELWKAVRASSSIPAVFPPFIKEDGEVLVDGALIDNVPINIMRSLKAGPNIVLNFKQAEPWRVNSQYERMPGRVEAARRVLFRRKSDQRFPSIPSVLLRAMVINARRLLEETDFQDDVLLEIPRLPKMGFLEWKRGREQFNAAYQEMRDAIAQVTPQGCVIQQVREASLVLNEKAQENNA